MRDLDNKTIGTDLGGALPRSDDGIARSNNWQLID